MTEQHVSRYTGRPMSEWLKVVGWPMGVEPITFGSTIRCSAG